MLWILAAGSLVSPKPIPAMYPAPISNSTPGPPSRWACCKHQNLQHAQSHEARRHNELHLSSTHSHVPTERSWENPTTTDAVMSPAIAPGTGSRLRGPRFVQLATAAAVVLAATAAVVVGHASAAATAATAVVAAPAEQEEDDENDPPRVVATAHETIVAIAVHKEYLQEVFSAALPLIPWYSGGPIVCVVQANKDSTLSNR